MGVYSSYRGAFLRGTWLALWCFGLVIILLGSTNTIAQEIPRVSPQVVTNTLVIDQDTDAKKLKENLLYIMKNVGQDEYVAYYLIMDAAVALVKDQIGYIEVKNDPASGFQTNQKEIIGRNEIELILRELPKVKLLGPDLIDTLAYRITRKQSATISETTKQRATQILDEWKQELLKKVNKRLHKWAKGKEELTDDLISKLETLDLLTASVRIKKYKEAFPTYVDQINDLETYLLKGNNGTERDALLKKIEGYEGLRVIRYCEISSGNNTKEENLNKNLQNWAIGQVELTRSLISNLQLLNADSTSKRIADYKKAFPTYLDQIHDLACFLKETDPQKRIALRVKIDEHEGLRVIRYSEITGSHSLAARFMRLESHFPEDTLLKELMDWAEKKTVLDDRLEEKIRVMTNLGLIVLPPGKKADLKDICTTLASTLPSIMGASIEEQDRIKAVTEITFQLQRVIENLKFEVKDDTLTLQLGNREKDLVVSKPGDTNFELLLRTLDSLASIVGRVIIDNVGSNHPATVHFDAIYAKIRVQAMSLKDKSGFAIVLNLPVKDFISDYVRLMAGEPDHSKYRYELCRRFVDQLKKADTEQWGVLSNEFAREFYIFPLLDILGSEILRDLTSGLKDPTRFAWINNINSGSGAAEFSTTVSFKVINHPRFAWEVNSNFFYNSLYAKPDTAISKSDTLATSPLFIGSSWHWSTPNNKWEFSIVSSISGRSFASLGKANSGMHTYLGASIAYRLDKVILRPFFEWEYEATAATEKATQEYTHQYISGLEVRLPKQFVFNSVFLSYKSDTRSLAFGIKFPVVK